MVQDNNFNPIQEDLKYHAVEVFKRFLVSKETPLSKEKDSEIEKISKNLSLLIWIGKADILSPEEEKAVIEKLKDLNYNFKQDDLYDKTSLIIQDIKNLNHKIDILEHFTDIEHVAYMSRGDWDEESGADELYEKFERIISFIKDKNKEDNFNLMKIERDIRDIKKIYLKDPSKISLLMHNLEKIIHQ